jgi:GR25 family glycosyltransferase involved in LPS biosynthesis
MRDLTADYAASDAGPGSAGELELRRHSALELRGEEALKFLSPAAAQQLKDTQRTGLRVRHSDLSTGAVGCFLSHVTVMRMLLHDEVNDAYVVMEDDTLIPRDMRNRIDTALQEAPSDWDVILFGYHLLEYLDEQQQHNKLPAASRKVRTFWGTHAYLLNKRGARKFVDSYQRDKIQVQIDSQMSMLARAGNLNVYIANRADVVTGDHGTDIQLPIMETGLDPFEIEMS